MITPSIPSAKLSFLFADNTSMYVIYLQSILYHAFTFAHTSSLPQAMFLITTVYLHVILTCETCGLLSS